MVKAKTEPEEAPEEEVVEAPAEPKFTVVRDEVLPVLHITKNGYLGDPFDVHVDDVDELVSALWKGDDVAEPVDESDDE
jgi:hypothetical protein